MNRIGIVILHYGDPGITDQCIASASALDGQETLKIVVVDNDLPEKRKNLRERYQRYPSVTVIENQEGHGFSHANNLGYCYARNQLGCTCILVVNNDILFTQKDCLNEIQKICNQNRCEVLAPDVVRYSTGEHQNPMDVRLRTCKEARQTVLKNHWMLRVYGVVYPFLIKMFERMEEKQSEAKKKNEEYYRKPHEKIVPFGACLVFMPKFVKKESNAFEPETEFYYEEYLLALRCQKKQYRILYSPAVRVLHESGGATKSSMKSRKEKLYFIMKHTEKSCRIYIKFLKGK